LSATVETQDDANSHVHQYLSTYLSFTHPPGFAVLLSGRWGSGKTHLVKDLVAKAADDGRRLLLISLYGLSTRLEIDQAIYLARYPWSATGATPRTTLQDERVVQPSDSRVADPLGHHWAVPPADAYVFDDLERCAMPAGQALGYINQLVEREGRKVVVVAFEEKITKDETQKQGYLDAKEKVIGKTIVVNGDFDNAFTYFLTSIDSADARDFLVHASPEIRSIYDNSNLENLRILQQCMWDFERLHLSLSDTHRDNLAAMINLLQLFFALSFELKASRLEPEDLIDRGHKSLVGLFGEKGETNRLQAANARYPGVRLSDSILSDEVLVDVLSKGLVNQEAVRSALDGSSWFVQDNEPTWRAVWHAHERDDAETEAAAAKLREEFDARFHRLSGEVLHLLGLMLRLTDLGVTGWTREQAVDEGKRYIDDLRSSDRLEPPKLAILDDVRLGNYAGLGFAESNTAEFGELFAYLSEQRNLAERDRYALQAQHLAKTMTENPDLFVRQISTTGDGEANYVRVPVLSRLDPAAFADRLIALPPLQFRTVVFGLSARYDLGAFRRELAEEKCWAEALERAIVERAEALGPFGRDRILRHVKWTLAERLNEAGRTPKEPGAEDSTILPDARG
jgi:hypothetical protein